MRYGINHAFGSNTSIKPVLTVADHVAYSNECEHKVDEHWTVKVNQSYDSRRTENANAYGWSLHYEA